MLPLTERLRRANLFTKAYGAKKSVVTPLFTLYVLPRQPQKSEMAENKIVLPMTGFVISKKVCKSACKRNRIKRRIREAYRQMRTKSLGQWYVMVLVIKESVLKVSWSDICRTMEDAFAEAAKRYR